VKRAVDAESRVARPISAVPYAAPLAGERGRAAVGAGSVGAIGWSAETSQSARRAVPLAKWSLLQSLPPWTARFRDSTADERVGRR
jgi:hypothetical protein